MLIAGGDFMFVLTGAEDGPMWRTPDSIFGLSARTMLRIGGIITLLLAAYMAFASQPTNLALLALLVHTNSAHFTFKTDERKDKLDQVARFFLKHFR